MSRGLAKLVPSTSYLIGGTVDGYVGVRVTSKIPRRVFRGIRRRAHRRGHDDIP